MTTTETETAVRPFDYEGQQVRTITGAHGEPWFVATDVARILGYREAKDMTRRLDEDDKGRRSVPTPGGVQQLTVITEPGLYAAVLGSQVPGARAFKRWITHEVLPTIRRTGGYGHQAPAPAELTRSDLARMVLDAETEKAQAQAALAAAAPKVDYHDTFVATDDMISVRTLANQLSIGEQALRDLLIRKKWIYRESHTRWSNKKGRLETCNQYRAYAEKKPYFTLRAQHDAPRLGGKVQQTLFITPAGAEAIHRLLERHQHQTELTVITGDAA